MKLVAIMLATNWFLTKEEQNIQIDTNEKERLVHMTKKEGKDEFNNFIVQPQRTISEVLEHFSSIKEIGITNLHRKSFLTKLNLI